MFHIPRLSEAVYVGICRKIGTPTQVKIRRDIEDIHGVVMRPVSIMRGFDRMVSGSRREGFRLRTSDEDWMMWSPDHKVICDLSQIRLYSSQRHTLILMECEDFPPGFTRLNLLRPSNNALIRFSCVVINNKVYISSTLFRDNHLQFLRSSYVVTSCSIPHGPCSTFVLDQDREIDYAFCFRSHHWPTTSLPWIQRCRQKGWPSETVLSDILSGGFHVVPIGSSPENGEEWRISFSQAEQKLVYSMNHCQFLCYGLFKFFLSEVINFQNSPPILCSYFIKTIVFWVIHSNDSLTWTPDNLLSCFWECFKLLIHWVHIGECPNFFIPNNNMFRQKVIGSVQTSLFSQLYDLYCNGISCVLLSKTLRPCLSNAILYRPLRVCTDESTIISNTHLDMSLFKELPPFMLKIDCIEEFALLMKQIERLIRRILTPYQAVTLQCMSSEVLHNTAMLLQSTSYTFKTCNKVNYRADKVPGLLKLSCKLGNSSNALFLAMYFYRNCRYEHSLTCLQRAQERISVPYIVYNGHVNVDVYRRCMAGISIGKKISKARLTDIVFNSRYTYLDELVLEQKIGMKNGMFVIGIPPLVMLHMLFILNHHRLGDTVKSQQSLIDLETLLLFDYGVYAPGPVRDISWQILGICKQICGDYLGSLQCYQYSLQQLPFHKIQEATLFRMNTLANEEM